MTAERAAILAAVPGGARVLDVGCGDGALLATLRDEVGVDARGLEIDPAKVAAAMARGLPVVQGDADTDLADYPDDAFDVAILTDALPAMRDPARVLRELLRIAPRALVAIPNFGHWRVRVALATGGRMPVTRTLPVAWHATPNIHLCTVADLHALVAELGFVVDRASFFAGGRPVGAGWANLRADHAVLLIARKALTRPARS